MSRSDLSPERSAAHISSSRFIMLSMMTGYCHLSRLWSHERISPTSGLKRVASERAPVSSTSS